MLLGRQVAVPDVHGAINYWCEAVQIAATLHKAAPDRIMDLRYEDLVADVPGAMAGVLGSPGLPAPAGLYRGPTPIPNGTSGATRWARRNGRPSLHDAARWPGPMATTWRPASLRPVSPLDLPVTGSLRCLTLTIRKTRARYVPATHPPLRRRQPQLRGCAARAQTALARLPGVEAASRELRDTPRRLVVGPGFDAGVVGPAMDAAGYPVTERAATAAIGCASTTCIAAPAWRGPKRRFWRCPACPGRG
jgi:hypothetical protein